MAARVEGWKAGDGEFCWPRETKISRYYMKERQRASRSLWKAEVKAAEKWGLETSWHRVLENEILANWSETRHQLHPLVFPGTWTAAKVKLRQAATLSKLRSKCIMFGSPGVSELRIWTTASLSTRNRMRLRDQLGPQTWVAETTEKNSL